MLDDLLPMAASNEIWVVDRGHGTELVMSAALDRKVEYSNEDFNALDNVLGIFNTIIFYLDVDDFTLAERMGATGRQAEGDLRQIKALWEVFLKSTECSVVRLDGTWPPELIAQRILDNIKVPEGE